MAKDGGANFDKRVVNRYIQKGRIKDSEYASHLKSLPDDEKNLEWVSYDLEEAELSETAAAAETSEAPAADVPAATPTDSDPLLGS